MVERVERRIFVDINLDAGRRHDDKPRLVLDEKRVPIWLMPTVFGTLNVIHYLWISGVV